MAAKAPAKPARTTQGLRDILFDEIDGLRDGSSETDKALAVANLAKQIVNTAKVELEFHRAMHAMDLEGTPIKLGNLALGQAA